MNEENARRLAARRERDRHKIAVDDVGVYRELHYPGSLARRDAAAAYDIPEVPGDSYIAQLTHARFHEWFGTVCDDTCPHAKAAPVANARQPWWRRWFR